MITSFRPITGRPQPRLLRDLADFLEKKVPKNEFNMMSFCGTARCAWGWAPSVPSCARRGLGYVPRDNVASVECPVELLVATQNRFGDVYVGYFSQIATFFGITQEDADQTFTPKGHRETTSSVAGRLRKLANKYEELVNSGWKIEDDLEANNKSISR